VARLGTSLNIGADIPIDKKPKKPDPDIKIEEIDPEEVDHPVQKTLVEPQKPKKIKLEKYGEHTIPNAILKFLDRYGIFILLLLCVTAGVWSLQQPIQLREVQTTVEKTLWKDLAAQTALKLDVDFPFLSPGEKSNLFDREFAIVQQDPKVLTRLNDFVTDAKSYFIDNTGYTYLFNREAYDSIQEKQGLVGFLHAFVTMPIEHLAAVVPFVLGILSIILIFYAGNLLGKYGGFFAALLLAMHPSFVKSMYFGKLIPDVTVIPLTLFVLVIVLHLASKNKLATNTSFILLFFYLFMVISNQKYTSASIKAASFHIYLIPLALISIAYMMYSFYRYPKKNYQHLVLLLFGIPTIILTFFAEGLFLVAFPVFILFVAHCLVKAMPGVVYLLEQTQLDFQERTWNWTGVVLIGCIIFLGFLPAIVAYTPHPAMNDALYFSAKFMAGSEDIKIIALPEISSQLAYYSKQTSVITEENMDLLSKALISNDETNAYNYIKEICQDTCAEKIYVVMSASYLKRLPQLLEQSQIVLSGISRCGNQAGKWVCENGYVIDGVNVTKGTTPAEVISYIDGKQTAAYPGQHSLILFRNNDGFYTFTIDEKYANTMLVRLIGQDNFTHFNLKYRAERPEQIFVYEVLL